MVSVETLSCLLNKLHCLLSTEFSNLEILSTALKSGQFGMNANAHGDHTAGNMVVLVARQVSLLSAHGRQMFVF